MAEIELDDELNSRWIQGAGSVPFSPIIDIPPPVPGGISSLSTLGKAKEVEAEPQRPILPQPRHVILDLGEFLGELEESYSESVGQLKTDIEHLNAKTKTFDTEREEVVRKEIEATKSRDTWSTLGTIAKCGGGVGMATLGFATGGPVGWTCFVLALLFVVNEVLDATSLKEPTIALFIQSEERQKRIKEAIDTGAFYLQLGLGLCGGYAAWQAAVYGVPALVVATKAAAALTTASSVLGAGAKAGMEVYKRRMAHEQAKRIELDLGITTANQEKKEVTDEIIKTFEQSSVINKVVQDGIEHLDIQLG